MYDQNDKYQTCTVSTVFKQKVKAENRVLIVVYVLGCVPEQKPEKRLNDRVSALRYLIILISRLVTLNTSYDNNFLFFIVTIDKDEDNSKQIPI